MAIPLLQVYRVAKYLAGRKLRGDKRYPLVLMLEPLFQCNLACSGCGKIDYPKEILQKRVSLEDALRAVDECGAPIVSIPGGEPLIHKEMPQIVAGIVARKKFVYLCTNAILLAKHIDEYQPSPTAIGSGMMSPCVRRACSTRRWRPSSSRAARAFG
jgi:hopanoid biosynthesis associated radical SAM protein HpnH